MKNQDSKNKFTSRNKNKTDKTKNKKRTKKPLIDYDDSKNLLILSEQLPHSFLLEKTLLSCVIVYCDTSFQTLETIMEHLPIDAFYFKNHQELYKTFIKMYSQNLSIDFITTIDFIQCYGLVSNVGGLSVISELLKEIPTIVYLMDYIRLVKQKYVRRCVIRIGLKAVDNGFIMNLPIQNQLTSLDYEIQKLASEIQPKEINFTSSELLNKILADLLTKSKKPGQLSGIPSGFTGLDLYTDGLQKSELIILAGRPSVGKTAFSLNILLNVLQKTRLPVIFFSLEMSTQQLMYRLLAIETRLDQKKFKTGFLNPGDWKRIELVMKILGKIPLHLQDTPHLSTLKVRKTLKTFQKIYPEIGLVIIDYLQLMEESFVKTTNRAQEISLITRELKNIAREFEVPIMALSQLSRTIDGRMDPKPMLSDLRDSGSIEQDADLVLMLYKNNQAITSNLSSGSSIIELAIAKQRNGPIGNTRLLFNESLTRFEDYN
jgi:replicative DNA helicase